MPKTPSKTPNRPGGKGGLLLTGNPGNKGGGRTPDEFKKLCQELACSGAAGVAKIMQSKSPHEHPAFLGALKWATEHGYGKPKESIELRGAGPNGELQVWHFGSKPVKF